MSPFAVPDGPAGRPGEVSDAVRSALEALPLGVLIFNSEVRLTFANPRGSAWLSALASPETLPALLDPQTERPVTAERSPLARALRGLPSEGEVYMVRRDSGPGALWIECGARPMTSADGVSIESALFSFRDITTERKRAFEAESANQLRDFIYRENLAGIVHATVDGRLLDCNDAILKMVGYASRDELFALRASQLHHDGDERDRMIHRLAETGQLNEYEVCFRRKDGSRCWALVNVRLIAAPRGQVGGSIVATVIDISERKIQEETLRLSEQRFSAFMRHLPGVAFIKDLSGRYVYYNEAVWSLFGIRPESITGKTDDQVWPPENAALYRENDARVVAQGRPLEFVETVMHADGQHQWLMYKFPISEDGKVVLVGGVGIDITERTILEQQLTQSRKMDALGRLAGGVAHDFNNLLTVISGYGQLSLETLDEVPAETLADYLREILNSARRASALTGQLLAFSRRQAVQPKVMDLGDLLGNMERMLARLIGEHVDLTVRRGVGCLIHADGHQMEQVVMNLAVNARDAMPLGGSLEIRCRRVPVDEARAREESDEPLTIVLEVSDTGIGMDEQVLPRIFDPFFTSKEPSESGEQHQSAGLGLSLVYGIVSQAKGRIDVDSAPGEGTVFRLWFPEASDEIEKPAAPRSGSPQGEETVLLVEDEASVRQLAETMLVRLGYRVLVAESGPVALTVFDDARARVDVLLTDVIMPQMSGGELAHKLREKTPGLKVLFMSGYTDDMIASHGALAGETQLIQKPFTMEGLGRKLRDVLDA